MLDGYHCRFIEFPQGFDGRVGVVDVIEGQFFPVELLGIDQVAGSGLDFLVVPGFLVRVFAVPQVLGFFEGHGEVVRQSQTGFLSQVVGDHGVVGSGVLEHLQSQTVFGLIGDFAFFLQFGNDCRIIRRVADDHHVFVVLGSGAEHGRTADIDVFDGHRQSHIRFQNGFLEGVEVDGHDVDGLDPQLLQLVHVFRFFSHRQDPAVDCRVEGLDSAVQAFRESGHIGDPHDFYAAFSDLFVGAAGGDDGTTQGFQFFGEFNNAGFVGYTDECSHDFLLFSAVPAVGAQPAPVYLYGIQQVFQGLIF